MAKLTAHLDLGIVERTFAGGLLLTLQGALRSTRPGEMFALVSRDASVVLGRMEVNEDDRVIRPLARRGSAEAGIVLSRTDLAPELTVTADGVFWHPVGAEDRDLFVTREPLPLANAFSALAREFEREHALRRRMLKVFHCA